MARHLDITKLYNLVRNFGYGSYFFTLSPDDVHNPLAIRLCVRTRAVDMFPNDVVGNDFIETLRRDDDNKAWRMPNINAAPPDREATLKIDNASLRRYLAKNPVAAAYTFNRILVAFYTIVLGVEPSHLRGKGSKKSAFRAASRKGLFAHILAAMGCTEEQTRKALHHHLMAFSSLPPQAILN
eukprot:9492504-Pyramimonas_sp.AAC.1